MDTLHYSFDNIDAHLNALDGLNGLALQKAEELNAEMQIWANYWHGTAHEQALQFTTQVHGTLTHVVEASKQYVVKARMKNEDMRNQEHANTTLWG